MQAEDQPIPSWFYNMLPPLSMVQCDSCKRDITRNTKVLADGDYCVSCFAQLPLADTHYQVVDDLGYPLFTPEWTAYQELLLIEGMLKHGYGNWTEIDEFMGQSKSPQQIEEHYQQLYLSNHSTRVPVHLEVIQEDQTLTRRDKEGFLVTRKPGTHTYTRYISEGCRQSRREEVESVAPVPVTRYGHGVAEVVGYMPRRGDFEVEYDNEAQLLLAELQFSEGEPEEEAKMKYRMIEIYNQRLSERIRRKEFVISRGLLDHKIQNHFDKTRNKEEKEMYALMKVFARFQTPEEHTRLVQGLITEKQIRQRIKDLQAVKKKGIKTLVEARNEFEDRRMREERAKAREQGLQSKSRQKRRDRPMTEEARTACLATEELQLCQKLGLNEKKYLMIKETLLRESVKQGLIHKDETSSLFKHDKLERNIFDAVFDLVVEGQSNPYWQR